MNILATIMPYIQVAFAVLLIVLVLIQQSDAGLGITFGGNEDASIEKTRRGSELVIFKATIVIAILFVVSVFLPLIVRV